jgi:hypothetical protein
VTREDPQETKLPGVFFAGDADSRDCRTDADPVQVRSGGRVQSRGPRFGDSLELILGATPRFEPGRDDRQSYPDLAQLEHIARRLITDVIGIVCRTGPVLPRVRE